MFLGIVYLSYSLQKIYKITRIIFCGLVISFLFSWFAKDEWYSLYFRSFLNISVTVGLVLALGQQQKKRMYAYVCIVLLLLSNSIVQLWRDAQYHYDYHAYAGQIVKLIPDHAKRICLFVNPDPYFEIKVQKKDKILHEYLYGSSERINYLEFYNNCDAMIFNRVSANEIFFPSYQLYEYYMTHAKYDINYDHPYYPGTIVVFKR